MPSTTDCDEGVAERVKSETVRLTPAVWVRPPPLAVIVKAELPAGVDVEVVTVRVEVPEPVTDDGLKDAVAPAGRPLTVKPTLLLKPLMALVEIV